MNFISKETTDSIDKKLSMMKEKRYATPQNPASFVNTKYHVATSGRKIPFESKTFKPRDPVSVTAEHKDPLIQTQPLSGNGLYESMSQSIYDRQFESTPKNRPSQPLKESGAPINLDLNMLTQLQQLQAQILNNPNIIQQTQNLLALQLNRSPNPSSNSSVKQSSTYITQIGELEKQLGEQRIENERLKTMVRDLRFELESREKQLESEQLKSTAAMEELENCQELRHKLEESMFEIQKLESERDFHHRNHMELRKDRYIRSNNDFQLSNLKRELSFKSDEVDSLKQRCTELQQNIEELMVFAEKPLNEKEGSTETFYAKKIVELEATIKRLREDKAEQETTGFRRSRRPSPRSTSYKDLGTINMLSDDKALTLKFENDALKQKNETARKEIQVLRAEIEKLRLQEGTTVNGNGQALSQTATREYQTQIEKLQQENLRLKQLVNTRSLVAKSENDDAVEDLQRALADSEKEKNKLQEEVKILKRELELKNKELVRLSDQNRDDMNQDTIQNLIEANKRMKAEIDRLQEQIRKMESFSRDSMLDSIPRY